MLLGQFVRIVSFHNIRISVVGIMDVVMSCCEDVVERPELREAGT